MEISLSPIQTRQGLFFASALRDISQQKQAEAALQLSEQRFRQMANSSPMMIWLTDVNGEPTFANQTWLDFTGLDSAKAISRVHWLGAIHPDDKATAFAAYYKNTKAHQAITTEYRLCNANGEWRWILDKGTPLFDERDGFTGYIGSAIDISGYKQAQLLLQDKERMLSESQRLAHIGSWSVDLASGGISWSDETYRIYGVAKETFALSRETFLGLIYPPDRAAMNRWLNDCLAGLEPAELDYRICLPDGAVRSICGNGGVQRDEQNRPVRLVGSVQDITERKQLEDNLREGHQSYRSIIDTSLDGFLVINLEGKLLDANETYVAQSGYSREALLAMSVFDLEAVENAVEVKAHIARMMANKSDRFESTHRRKDGSLWNIEVSVTYHEADGGKFFAFFRDISAQKQLNDELRIAAVAFEAHESIIITDADAKIIRVNQAFIDNTGYSGEELVGQTPRLFKSERHDLAFYQAMWQSIVSTGSWRGEIWDRRKNGEIYPKWLTITAVKDSSGAVTHYVGTQTDITLQKNNEIMLKTSEALFRQMADCSPIMIWTTDRQNRLTFANRALLDFIGVEQMVSLEWQKAIQFDEACSFIGDTLKLASAEYRLRRSDGSFRWVFYQGSPLQNEKEETTGYIGSLIDITELKNTEAARRLRRERFDLALQGSQDGIFDLDIVSGESFVSERFLEMLGYAPNEISFSEQAWKDFLHPDDLLATVQKVQQHLELRTPYSTEYRLRTKSGDYRWFFARAQALWNEQGQAIRMAGSLTDIHERKKTQLLLQDKQRMLSESQRIAHIGSWSVELPGNSVVWSDETYRIFGLEPQMLPARLALLFKLIHADDRAAMQAWLRNCLHGMRPEPIDVRLILADGQLRVVRGSGELQYDVNYQPLRMMGCAQDITERKQIEQDLTEAKQKAEIANHAKSEFLANMSHEIRTPLNAILGFIYLLLDTPLLPHQKSSLKKVYESSKALMDILNDILDYSKIEADHLKIEHLPLRIETLFKNMINLFGMQIEAKGLELFLEFDPDVPTEVSGDSFRLAQVLNNLVSNAIKFTQQGVISINVDCAMLPADANGQCSGLVEAKGRPLLLYFTVQDTGIGISSAHISQLFQPFVQADGTITRQYGGTGLGLAISRRLVRLMGGEMTVSSVEGQGSSFSFSVKVEAVPNAVSYRDAGHLIHLKALLVSDNQAARALVKRLLEAWGLTVKNALSVEQGLDGFKKALQQQQAYDIVIVDLRVSQQRRFSSAHQFRKIQATLQPGHPLQIIMVTGNQDEERLVQTGLTPLDEILIRPIMPSTLYDALSKGHNLGKNPHFNPSEKLEFNEMLRFNDAHILLVEDSTINQEVASSMLKKFGIVVTLASHGKEALEKIQRQNFDAVLMDLHMPVMDGFEATRCIRRLPQGQVLPIIAMTAAVMPEDRQYCVAVGMVDFIGKPIDPDELIKALKKWLPAHCVIVQPIANGGGSLPADLRYDLPSFDLRAALRRLGGDRHLLTRLLLDFAEQQAEFLGQLDKRLSDGDTLQAQFLLHTLKGAADNLGAAALAQSAAQLRDEIKAGGHRPSYPAFISMLEMALFDIHRYVKAAASTENGAVDRQAVLQLVDALRPFLSRHKLVPDPLMQALQTLSQTDLPGKPLAGLLQQIDRIDYDGALQTLAQIAAALAEETRQ